MKRLLVSRRAVASEGRNVATPRLPAETNQTPCQHRQAETRYVCARCAQQLRYGQPLTNAIGFSGCGRAFSTAVGEAHGIFHAFPHRGRMRFTRSSSESNSIMSSTARHVLVSNRQHIANRQSERPLNSRFKAERAALGR